MSERRDAALQAFRAAGGALTPGVAPLVEALGQAAPALLPLAIGDPSLPADVLSLGLDRELDARQIRALIERRIEPGEPALRRTLRRQRHRHLVRLALRESMGLADVDTTAREMSALASACTDLALEGAALEVTRQHGVPTTLGRAAQRVCLGMGKLGGGELNLGSDVDLCFFYETDDTDDPPDRKLSTHEIEGRIATRASKILADVDEDGFVFRVDLRLRPEGARGPVVNSLASAERYYESFGRSWERAVLLRSTPIAGDVALGQELLSLVRPFVFRKSVDPRIARDMAQMLERTRAELSVDDVRDVKLGRGGIREAEFFVQTLQLVWGGLHPELQVPGTLDALGRLLRLGLVSDREARSLEAAWALLRRVEHRVHVWLGYQSHVVPEGPELLPFARSLSFASGDELMAALSDAREHVALLFRSLLEETGRGTSVHVRLADQVSTGSASLDDVATLFEGIDVEEAAAHLSRLARHADDPLGPRQRERHPEFGPRLLEEIAESADPARALRFCADFFARLRGWDYVRLIDERGALRRFVSLFGMSDALASTVVGHPEDLDVLLSSALPSLVEVRESHAALAVAPDDPEAFVSSLRVIKRQLMLRVGLLWASGELDLDDVLSLLSELAEQQLRAAVAQASAELEARFGGPGPGPSGAAASLVIIALGKLGAREIGWGSDLDLVFVFDGPGQSTGPRSIEHIDLFTRVAQRTLRVLSQPDREGPGYEIDTRLRPSGAQGTLVASMDAFAHYESRSAAGWERQAWVRARPIAGTDEARARARELIASAAYGGAPPDPADVAAMRLRIEGEVAHESEHAVHPKLGRGALLDIEFLAQYLQLEVARDATIDVPGLRSPNTREALRALASLGTLSREDLAALLDGWRFFRSVEQSLRLVDDAGDGHLHLRSRVADRVARRMGLRDWAGQTAGEVLAAQFHRHRDRIRGIFLRVVARPDSVDASGAGPE